MPWGALGCLLWAVCPGPRCNNTGARCYRLRTPLRALEGAGIRRGRYQGAAAGLPGSLGGLLQSVPGQVPARQATGVSSPGIEKPPKPWGLGGRCVSIGWLVSSRLRVFQDLPECFQGCRPAAVFAKAANLVYSGGHCPNSHGVGPGLRGVGIFLAAHE